MRPGAPPQSCRYICTGPGEVSSLVTDPPGTPVTPCKIRSFTSIQMVHTHLLRNNIANFVVECITRAQNNPLKTARKNWLIQRDFQCEVNSLRPCSEEGSNAAKSKINKIMPDCDNSAEIEQCKWLTNETAWWFLG